ncbi:MAG: hypothetical protein P8Y70_03015 [Candidatus Lokiarchaeota archaeon]
MELFFILDLSIFIVINLANIFACLMFVGRVKKPYLADLFGKLFVSLGIPLFVIVVLNFLLSREWWFWIFPSILIAFIIFIIIVDYIKKIEFRKPKNYRILIPFLIFYYCGLILTWGITWAINIIYGIITSLTYFLQVGASIYASKHGVG